jgi:T5orf172 domain
MAQGRIYVLTSESQPGIVKVGKTSRTADERAEDLDGTALALPLVAAYEVVITNFDQIELSAHRLLGDKRVRSGREWFRCTVPEAVAAIHDAIQKFPGTVVVGEIDYVRAKEEANRIKVEADRVVAETRARREKEEAERQEEQRIAETRERRRVLDAVAARSVSLRSALIAKEVERVSNLESGNQWKLYAKCGLAVSAVSMFSLIFGSNSPGNKSDASLCFWLGLGGAFVAWLRSQHFNSISPSMPEDRVSLWKSGLRHLNEPELREFIFAQAASFDAPSTRETTEPYAIGRYAVGFLALAALFWGQVRGSPPNSANVSSTTNVVRFNTPIVEPHAGDKRVAAILSAQTSPIALRTSAPLSEPTSVSPLDLSESLLASQPATSIAPPATTPLAGSTSEAPTDLNASSQALVSTSSIASPAKTPLAILPPRPAQAAGPIKKRIKTNDKAKVGEKSPIVDSEKVIAEAKAAVMPKSAPIPSKKKLVNGQKYYWTDAIPRRRDPDHYDYCASVRLLRPSGCVVVYVDDGKDDLIQSNAVIR